MSRLIIQGGRKLRGEIIIDGSKNAVLPILAATILNGGKNIIKNCPRLKDVEIMIEILMKIGCKVNFEGNTVIIDSSTIHSTEIPEYLASGMRSSIIFMGPLLSKYRKVNISYPGGCEIGPRPIDLHLKALRSLGARIQDTQHGFIQCETDRLKGCEIQLDYPSVGATENIMLAAVFADGVTTIKNAAREPEIVDLQNFMIGIGVEIYGAGTSIIKVVGKNYSLHQVEHSVMPDRIVAGTYMIAAAITGGDMVLKNIQADSLGSIISCLRESGCKINVKNNDLSIIGPIKPKAIDSIRTLPYPGFPTDMQAQMVAYLSIAKGVSIIVETVFESRYKHIEELMRMGANIKLEGRLALIKGVKKLTGASVNSWDLRGGAALVLAGLVAEGETILSGVNLIDRGYQDIELKLLGVGADIRRDN